LQVDRLDKNVFVDESDGYSFVFLERGGKADGGTGVRGEWTWPVRQAVYQL